MKAKGAYQDRVNKDQMVLGTVRLKEGHQSRSDQMVLVMARWGGWTE